MSRAFNQMEAYRIFAYVREHILHHGYGPTRREIAEAVGCSKNNVPYRLRKLQRAGYITLAHNADRGIALTAFGRTLLPWE